MLGAIYLGDGRCKFTVWAPKAESVSLKILTDGHADQGGEGGLDGRSCQPWRVSTPGAPGRLVTLEKLDHGYHAAVVEGITPGTRYVFSLDGRERPDPASRFQPEGVHGPSQVIDLAAFKWNDAGCRGLALEDYILSETHVGCYTEPGTFEAIIPHLDELQQVGINAIELMPVAQFPGTRNWGYDGVYPFAAQSSYGGPEGLGCLVDACHARGMAVVLDVVYNHLGPEGNYLADFGPYFTDYYRTPWGQAINFDGAGSDEVVRYFIENALQWVRDFHFDALRLDAIHGITDRNAQPFLKLLGRAVHAFAVESGRRIYLIAESDFNDARFIHPVQADGYGLDAQWSDDFHHAVHTLLTKESTGYYLDFGKMAHLEKALAEGFVYSGQYSLHRQCRHGNSSRDLPPRQFVVFTQNHDQVGNRPLGDRLSTLVSFEALKLTAGMVTLSPYIPLLFMGQEYGEPAPFPYFTSHNDLALIEAVRRGRREEFAAFLWQGAIPDAQNEETFLQSKLDHRLRRKEPHSTLQKFYQEAIRLRRTLPGLADPSKERMVVQGFEEERVLQIRRWSDGGEALLLANFGDGTRIITLAVPEGTWRLALDSADQRWRGPGTHYPGGFESSGKVELTLRPKSTALFERL